MLEPSLSDDISVVVVVDAVLRSVSRPCSVLVPMLDLWTSSGVLILLDDVPKDVLDYLFGVPFDTRC